MQRDRARTRKPMNSTFAIRSLLRGLLGASAAALALGTHAASSGLSSAALPVPSGPAQFGKQAASRDVHALADWVVSSRDSGGRPFVVVDKRQARVFVFDAGG